MVNFGNRLKSLRTAAGYTQAELAQKLNITKSVVSYYELQERTPSPERFAQCFQLFSLFSVTYQRQASFRMLFQYFRKRLQGDVDSFSRNKITGLVQNQPFFFFGRGKVLNGKPVQHHIHVFFI